MIMKKIFRITILFFGLILVLSSKCVDSEPPVYPLYLMNNSNYSIGYYFAIGGKYGTFYPDSLPETDYIVGRELSENEKFTYYGDVEWDNQNSFNKYFPHDTLSVFIFSSDTLNKYTWEEVRDGYKILKRYDLSYQDLEEMDYTITYP
jgi:hypothetical protein